MRIKTWRIIKSALLLICLASIIFLESGRITESNEEFRFDGVKFEEEYRKLYGNELPRGHHSRKIKRNDDIFTEDKSKAIIPNGSNSLLRRVNRLSENTRSRRKSDLKYAHHGECKECPDVNYIRYINNASHICASNSPQTVDLLLMIISEPYNTDVRNLVRQTWASASRNNTDRIRHVFVLARPYDSARDEAFEIEEQTHRDLIMIENIYDNYKNLTYKTLGALRWASTWCQNAKYVMKVDDDIYLNTDELFSLIKSSRIPENSLTGSCHWGGLPVRDKRSKWYVSRQAYSPSTYPPYCQGPGYIMSLTLAQQIISISHRVPFITMEDAYIGLCVQKLKGEVITLDNFYMSRGHIQDNWLKLCNLRKEGAVVFHKIYAYELPMIFNSRCD